MVGVPLLMESQCQVPSVGVASVEGSRSLYAIISSMMLADSIRILFRSTTICCRSTFGKILFTMLFSESSSFLLKGLSFYGRFKRIITIEINSIKKAISRFKRKQKWS